MMSEDQQMPMTLAVEGSPIDVSVVTISGSEALNEAYCFTIDLVSADPDLQTARLERRSAYLAFGPKRGVHGTIISITRLYAGKDLSLYRAQVGPRLLELNRVERRRIFQGLSVPQIVERLLAENGMNPTAYRFDQTVGVYPVRPMCVQHDESDLHLLQRLCEEEGIHFRFEHSPNSHVMIFADDPASFPQRLFPIRFQPTDPSITALRSISHFAERWQIHSATTIPGAYHQERTLATESAIATAADDAPNQRFEPSATSRLPSEEQAHERQISVRALERQRCERRLILGQSDEFAITTGQVIQVHEHPVPALNDQWLLVEVTHTAKQMHAFEGHVAEEIAAITELLQPTAAAFISAPSEQYSGAGTQPSSRAYRNHFRVLPWEMAFRPALKHTRPPVRELQTATLLSGETALDEENRQARLPVRFDWQSEPAPGRPDSRSLACFPSHLIDQLRTGTRLLIGHLDCDPDRPAIVEVHGNRSCAAHRQSEHKLTVTTPKARFELTPERITVTSTETNLRVQDCAEAVE